LLLDIKAAVGKAGETGRRRLALRQKKEFLGQYDRLVSEAGKLYEPLKSNKGRANNRRSEELSIVGAARKLVNGLGAKRDEILLFMTDFKVPFDNINLITIKRSVICGC